MLARLLAHLRNQWMGALALFLVLTGGVAYATHETILSSDIVDNQVFSADVRNDTLSSGGLAAADLRSGSVGTSEVLNDTATGGGLAAADLRSGSVGTAEVADNSLRGADLGVQVRGARQAASSVCGQSAQFSVCTELLFTVPRAQRLLLVGSGEWIGLRSTGNNGECRFSVPTVGTFGLRRFGETGSGPSSPFNFAMNSVTPVVNQGQYELGIECRDATGAADSSMTVVNTEMSVVALGDG